jgi:RNA polymerase sigma factor (sigma-70 family)
LLSVQNCASLNFLLKRLANWEDNASWHAFFETYWRLIYGFAVRRGLSHEEAQEVVQETVVAVAKSIGNFKYDPQVCAFKTWLLSVTRSKVADQFARRARHANSTAPPHEDAANSDMPETADKLQMEQWDKVWEDEWQKNLMETAIRRVKEGVSIEQYQMFDLFVLKEWPARDVAKALGVTTAHVYVAKHRISKLIRNEVEALKSRPL